MSDWRERVSGPALGDFELLLATVLPSAESTLKRFGKLQPFGASLTTDGDIVRLNADPRLGENPPARDVVRHPLVARIVSAYDRRDAQDRETGPAA